MKLSWNNLKISIAGAKLSHLMQKDSIWDHGSMIEHVRTVFTHLKKAFLRNDPTVVKKCLTAECFKRISKEIELKKGNLIMSANLVSVEVISVIPSKHNQPDKFKALIKLKKIHEEENLTESISFYKINRLTEQEWLFMSEGNWWLLHEIKE